MRCLRLVVRLVVLTVSPAVAQQSLTLQDAVRESIRRHPAAQAAAADAAAASARVDQARSAYFPKLSYSESFLRSDNPVFVFSSLLTQRQFTEAHFAIPSLIRPGFVNNFQSIAAADQTVYDWGATTAQVRAAQLALQATEEGERLTRSRLIARVVRAYFQAILAEASRETAAAALRSADADLQHARNVRQAGLSTDADVLSIEVHRAAIREAEIRRTYDAQIAVAALNEALGLPLDTPHLLATPLHALNMPREEYAAHEATAANHRGEIRQAVFAAQIAEQQRAAARSALLPQIAVRGVFEADRIQVVNRGGANWLFGATLRWNLFDGHAARARMAEAGALGAAARAREREARAGVTLEVRRAWADLQAAGERIGVADAAVTQAVESLRITRNRYQAGLATVTDLLRNETALLETRMRRLAAIHDQRVAATQLELAAGTLTADSEVLK